jgi:methyl-accepting chemotaxis protein
MLKEARSVVQGSEQQAEAVDACSLAVEEMTRGMVSIEDITHQTAANASQSKALSVQGGELTGRLASEIERIAASVQASAEVIAKLGERSKAISGITDAIRDIADQTNLPANRGAALPWWRTRCAAWRSGPLRPPARSPT